MPVNPPGALRKRIPETGIKFSVNLKCTVLGRESGCPPLFRFPARRLQRARALRFLCDSLCRVASVRVRGNGVTFRQLLTP